jgi:hypothetical protein
MQNTRITFFPILFNETYRPVVVPLRAGSILRNLLSSDKASPVAASNPEEQSCSLLGENRKSLLWAIEKEQ